MDTQKDQSDMASYDVRLISPTSFPLDPRYQQARTTKVQPAGRVFWAHKRDQSRLLSLPDEILWQITELIADPEQGRFLSQFALAHRECRQLARPHQFADIFVSRTDKSRDFLRHLVREFNRDESEPAGWGPGPPIGACIRSLSFTVGEELIVDYGPPFSTDQELEDWCERWQLLIDDLAQAVECAMPRLERVRWMDTAELEVQPRLLGAILRHCSSGRVYDLAFGDYKFLFEEIDHVAAMMPTQPIHLRSLALGHDEDAKQNDPDGCAAYLAENILRSCAPMLQDLVWNAEFMGKDPDDYSLDRELTFLAPIEFPKLRKFWAGFDGFVGLQSSVLESFLAAPLESFAPSATVCSLMMDNKLVEKFPLPHLRTFAICAVEGATVDDEETVPSLASLYAQQIEELFIYLQGDMDQLATHLSGDNFCNLRSLCFSWVDNLELPALKAIGSSLVALEELSFGLEPAKDMTDSTYMPWNAPGWPSHGDIIAAISPLQKLVRLGVFGDEYIADWCGEDWAWHRFFKEFVWFHQGRSRSVFLPRKHRPEGRLGHNRPGDKTTDWVTPMLTNKAVDPRSAMVEIAGKYAAAFPSLQEFVCGRFLLEVKGREQR